jgi:regulatory protein
VEDPKNSQNLDSRSRDSVDKIKVYVLKLLSYRARSEHEIRERLLQKGFNPFDVNRVIDDFKASGLINDLEAARSFLRIARDTKLLGIRGIKDFFYRKGISKEIAEGVLEGADEIESAIRLIEKMQRTKGINIPQDEKRLRQYMFRRGYSSDTIDEVLKRLKEALR